MESPLKLVKKISTKVLTLGFTQLVISYALHS